MKSAVFFVYVWPEARSSAAGVRTHDLLRWLLSDGWKITAVSSSKPSQYSEELEKMGIAVSTCAANEASQDEFLRALAPALVLFDRFVMEEQFGWKAREFWPNALVLVDTQDLHSVRRAREALLKKNASPEEILRLPNLGLSDDMVRELSSLHRADGAIVVSSWEADFLRARFQFPAENLLHLPLMGRPDESPFPREGRQGFAFLGNFRHAPNLDGILWFIAEIWPRWRALNKTAELHLYGAYPPAHISFHAGKNGIHAHGPVADHRAALKKHEALVAPLRFGAGIKGKILEAWGTGTPVIGTPLAFEGMCKPEDKAGVSFQDADGFIQAAGLGEAWSDFQRNGFSVLRRDFAENILREKFLAFIEARASAIRQNGRVGITGALLRHAQNNATKYFSRWIEAKNKKS
ncbi:MAG: glycosyltransferase [Bacteriovoracia bacterium]